MDFVDEVRTRSGRFAERVKHWESETPTEEATKTSLILPFIQMLGYDIFDPAEVVPEFTADIGIKRGEKVDYAIMQRGKPAILIECKRYGSNLADRCHLSARPLLRRHQRPFRYSYRRHQLPVLL